MTNTVKSDAQLRFDKTLEVLALLWAETIKRLSATQAQRDHERAENAHLWRVYDAAVAFVAAYVAPGNAGRESLDLQDALSRVPPRGEKEDQDG